MRLRQGAPGRLRRLSGTVVDSAPVVRRRRGVHFSSCSWLAVAVMSACGSSTVAGDPRRASRPGNSDRSKALFENTSSRLTCWVREEENQEAPRRRPVLNHGSDERDDLLEQGAIGIRHAATSATGRQARVRLPGARVPVRRVARRSAREVRTAASPGRPWAPICVAAGSSVSPADRHLRRCRPHGWELAALTDLSREVERPHRQLESRASPRRAVPGTRPFTP